MANIDLTAQRLRELLSYDHATGVFTWISPKQRINVGDVAGHRRPTGYVVIKLDGVRYFAHRLAVLFSNGSWPTGDIDHIDGDPSNNRITNLRDVSRSENIQNQRKPHRNNKCGMLGIYKKGHKWFAQIRSSGETIKLGSFDSPELAHSAYLAAKQKHHSTVCNI